MGGAGGTPPIFWRKSPRDEVVWRKRLVQVQRRVWKQERDSLLSSPHAPRGHRVLSHIHYFFSLPPPPTGYVRIRLKSGAIIGVEDCKCRVGAGSTRFHRKSQMSYIQDKGPITIRTHCTTRRHKLTRELASLRGSRVEFQEMGDRFAILFEFFMNFPRVRYVVRWISRSGETNKKKLAERAAGICSQEPISNRLLM